MKTLSLLILGFAICVSAQAQRKVNVGREIASAQAQYELMLESLPDVTRFPQSIKEDGSLDTRPSHWWGSGFFGGSLWYIYEYSQDNKWKEAAHKWTMAVEKEKNNTRTHDLGFMLYCPFGNGYRLTGNEVYK